MKNWLTTAFISGGMFLCSPTWHGAEKVPAARIDVTTHWGIASEKVSDIGFTRLDPPKDARYGAPVQFYHMIVTANQDTLVMIDDDNGKAVVEIGFQHDPLHIKAKKAEVIISVDGEDEGSVGHRYYMESGNTKTFKGLARERCRLETYDKAKHGIVQTSLNQEIAKRSPTYLVMAP